MRTEKDIEAYLLRLSRRFEAASGAPGEPTTYLVYASEAMPPIAVRVDPPLVVLRVNIGDVAKLAHPKPEAELALFRKLLELNVKALVHASYGLDGDRIVLSAALELENLDFNELEAALDEVDLALAQQVPVLAELSARRESNSPASKKA
jgi:hypothetical protein